MFTPIRTERLLIRPFLQGDAAGLAARRTDPPVAKFQNRTLPFTLERAEEVVSELVAMEGLENEEWWMAVPETDRAVDRGPPVARGGPRPRRPTLAV